MLENARVKDCSENPFTKRSGVKDCSEKPDPQGHEAASRLTEGKRPKPKKKNFYY